MTTCHMVKWNQIALNFIQCCFMMFSSAGNVLPNFQIVFLASLPGLSVEIFELTSVVPSANYASLTLFGNELHAGSFKYEKFHS